MFAFRCNANAFFEQLTLAACDLAFAFASVAVNTFAARRCGRHQLARRQEFAPHVAVEGEGGGMRKKKKKITIDDFRAVEWTLDGRRRRSLRRSSNESQQRKSAGSEDKGRGSAQEMKVMTNDNEYEKETR